MQNGKNSEVQKVTKGLTCCSYFSFEGTMCIGGTRTRKKRRKEQLNLETELVVSAAKLVVFTGI